MIRKVKPILFDASNSYALPLYEITTNGQLAEAYLVLTKSGFLYATNHSPDDAIYIWYIDQQFTADELNDILQDEEIIDYCQKILDGEYDELYGNEVDDLIYKRNPKYRVYNDIIQWLVDSEFSDRFTDVWPPDKTIDEAINDIIEKAPHNNKVPAIIVDANAKEKLLELAYSIYQDEPGELSNTHIQELIRHGYIVDDKQWKEINILKKQT